MSTDIKKYLISSGIILFASSIGYFLYKSLKGPSDIYNSKLFNLLPLEKVKRIYKRISNMVILELFIHNQFAKDEFDSFGYYKGDVDSLQNLHLREFKSQILEKIKENERIIIQSEVKEIETDHDLYERSFDYYVKRE